MRGGHGIFILKKSSEHFFWSNRIFLLHFPQGWEKWADRGSNLLFRHGMFVSVWCIETHITRQKTSSRLPKCIIYSSEPSSLTKLRTNYGQNWFFCKKNLLTPKNSHSNRKFLRKVSEGIFRKFPESYNTKNWESFRKFLWVVNWPSFLFFAGMG